MWYGSNSKTAPYLLKKTLGSRISRFSGYGQQDSCELVNFVLDLLHEDLNEVISEIDHKKHPILHKFMSMIVKEAVDDENEDEDD